MRLLRTKKAAPERAAGFSHARTKSPDRRNDTFHLPGAHASLFGMHKRRPLPGTAVFFCACPARYLSMVSMVRCVLVKTQISAAIAMDSFTISEGVMFVWRSSARAAERA